MAVERLEIKPKMLRWAIQRAGFNEEMAIDAFPILSGWLSSQQQPTLSQLKKFSAKFYTPIGYLFLSVPPIEKVPFPMFRGAAGQTDHFDLNLYETVMSIQARQEWLEEYNAKRAEDSLIEPILAFCCCRFVSTRHAPMNSCFR